MLDERIVREYIATPPAQEGAANAPSLDGAREALLRGNTLIVGSDGTPANRLFELAVATLWRTTSARLIILDCGHTARSTEHFLPAQAPLRRRRYRHIDSLVRVPADGGPAACRLDWSQLSGRTLQVLLGEDQQPADESWLPVAILKRAARVAAFQAWPNRPTVEGLIDCVRLCAAGEAPPPAAKPVLPEAILGSSLDEASIAARALVYASERDPVTLRQAGLVALLSDPCAGLSAQILASRDFTTGLQRIPASDWLAAGPLLSMLADRFRCATRGMEIQAARQLNPRPGIALPASTPLQYELLRGFQPGEPNSTRACTGQCRRDGDPCDGTARCGSDWDVLHLSLGGRPRGDVLVGVLGVLECVLGRLSVSTGTPTLRGASAAGPPCARPTVIALDLTATSLESSADDTQDWAMRELVESLVLHSDELRASVLLCLKPAWTPSPAMLGGFANLAVPPGIGGWAEATSLRLGGAEVDRALRAGPRDGQVLLTGAWADGPYRSLVLPKAPHFVSDAFPVVLTPAPEVSPDVAST